MILTEAQRTATLQRFGSEPEPNVWSDQDNAEQIRSFLQHETFVKPQSSCVASGTSSLGDDFYACSCRYAGKGTDNLILDWSTENAWFIAAEGERNSKARTNGIALGYVSIAFSVLQSRTSPAG
jgi:hypothetical protein